MKKGKKNQNSNSILSGAAAADPGEQNWKSTANTSRRRCSVVNARRRKNSPVGKQSPAVVPWRIHHHSFKFRRRTKKRAIAAPPFHLKKLTERSRPRVAIPAQPPPLPPALRSHDGLLLLRLCSPLGATHGGGGGNG
ncbi:hypothetical protein V8G54_002321 [Vigna mungo]|uniref:Uncharacterized protein n=1 Tax=Vigna mungo TaxID=3915 RepID=A0AAQ3SAQ6_VIGMU